MLYRNFNGLNTLQQSDYVVIQKKRHFDYLLFGYAGTATAVEYKEDEKGFMFPHVCMILETHLQHPSP